MPPYSMGLASSKMSEWWLETRMARNWPAKMVYITEQSGVELKIFGDAAPLIRIPPEVVL